MNKEQFLDTLKNLGFAVTYIKFINLYEADLCIKSTGDYELWICVEIRDNVLVYDVESDDTSVTGVWFTNEVSFESYEDALEEIKERMCKK